VPILCDSLKKISVIVRYKCDMSLTCCVEGPSRVGNLVLAREGMLDMIIAMADSGSAVHVVRSTFGYLPYLLYYITMSNNVAKK